MNNNLWLKIFRSIGIVFFVTVFMWIVYFIKVNKYEEVVRLLVPLGVLISALIASYSVMISIDNAREIEESKQKKEENDELNILKLKTSILKQFLSSYFRDNSHYKETIKKSKIPDSCMHSTDMSYELLDKLNNYEQLIDTKVKNILDDQEILEMLTNINLTIGTLRATEKSKEKSIERGFTIRVSVEKSLIDSLGKFEEKLEKLRNKSK